MTKFVYKYGGDNRYKSPFTGIDHVFVGNTPTNIEDPRDIEILRRSEAFFEIYPQKVEIVEPIKPLEEKILEPIKQLEVVETIKAVPIGKTAPKSTLKTKR